MTSVTSAVGPPAARDKFVNDDRKNEILSRQENRESSARVYARSLPIVPIHATGMTITGADGKTYLDCLSGAGVLALGHNHPEVIAALQRVLSSGAPLTTLDIATPIKDDFVETLFKLLPPALAKNSRIHFCGPTGSDAIEAAFKLTQTATQRKGLLAFSGAYHGMTAGALAATGSVTVRRPLTWSHNDVTTLPYPYSYRCPFGVGGAEGAKIGEHYIRYLLDDPHGGIVPPAAMILEPIQGEGGVIPAPDTWMRQMRDLTTKRDIPLIVDEVQTGVGRTGSFWAIDHSGITPDVLVLSKAIGGGLPLSVIVYSNTLDQWQPGAHTGTFRGNQLALAAGAATMRIVAEQNLSQRAQSVGDRLMKELKNLAKNHPSIGEVRGRGLMIGVEVVQPDEPSDKPGARPTAPELATRIRLECLKRGLIVELGGRDNAVFRLLPPLTITDEETDSVLTRLGEAWAVAESEMTASR